MKKIKSPWYGVAWIVVWTAALVWFFRSGVFNFKECVGLALVWAILVGITVYLLVQNLRMRSGSARKTAPAAKDPPSRNAPCPCGSGKKFKRCCGVGSA